MNSWIKLLVKVSLLQTKDLQSPHPFPDFNLKAEFCFFFQSRTNQLSSNCILWTRACAEPSAMQGELLRLCLCYRVSQEQVQANLTTQILPLNTPGSGLALNTGGSILHVGYMWPIVVSQVKASPWAAAFSENRELVNAVDRACMQCSSRRWLCLVTWTWLYWHSPW